MITVFDLKGYSSKIGIIKSLSEEFKIRSKYENILLIFLKIIFKYFRFYYLKIFWKKRFKKYN